MLRTGFPHPSALFDDSDGIGQHLPAELISLSRKASRVELGKAPPGTHPWGWDRADLAPKEPRRLAECVGDEG